MPPCTTLLIRPVDGARVSSYTTFQAHWTWGLNGQCDNYPNFFVKNIFVACRDGSNSNEGSQHMFLLRIKKNYL